MELFFERAVNEHKTKMFLKLSGLHDELIENRFVLMCDDWIISSLPLVAMNFKSKKHKNHSAVNTLG
jgi:hypothetical protein